MVKRKRSRSEAESLTGAAQSAGRKSVAADFDDALPLLQLANDFGPERFEPREWRAVVAVAGAKPHSPCAVFATKCTLDDVFIFGDNDPIAGRREIHDASVVGFAQTLISNGRRGVSFVGDPRRQAVRLTSPSPRPPERARTGHDKGA